MLRPGQIDLTVLPETDRTAALLLKSLCSESDRIAKGYRHPRNEVLADYCLEHDGLQHEHVAESGSVHRLDVDQEFTVLERVFILEKVFMKRIASAVWVGDLKDGEGVLTTESATLLQSQYLAPGDANRKGTNPYELIAAAHAACFSTTLASELSSAGFTPCRISTSATITIEQLAVGLTVTGIQIDVLAEVPRAKQSDFIRATVRAKTNCTISRLLKTNISMSAKLDNSENRGRHEA